MDTFLISLALSLGLVGIVYIARKAHLENEKEKLRQAEVLRLSKEREKWEQASLERDRMEEWRRKQNDGRRLGIGGPKNDSEAIRTAKLLEAELQNRERARERERIKKLADEVESRNTD